MPKRVRKRIIILICSTLFLLLKIHVATEMKWKYQNEPYFFYSCSNGALQLLCLISVFYVENFILNVKQFRLSFATFEENTHTKKNHIFSIVLIWFFFFLETIKMNSGAFVFSIVVACGLNYVCVYSCDVWLHWRSK